MKLQKQFSKTAIRTNSGKSFDLMQLDPDSICIEDIAHGLSNTARFAGQLNGFLSVAQHSVWVMSYTSPENQLAALLHDASEAYLGDMPSPLKELMPDFLAHEKRVMQAIAEKFGFDYPLAEEIHVMDKKVFQIEWNEFIVKDNHSFYWTPKQAKERFLEHFESLTNSLKISKAS
jgi:hypothetical protein